jgi:Putative addiction module component
MQIEQLASLSLQTRLDAMDLLWESFQKPTIAPEAIPSWHRTVLDERLRRIADGQEQVMAWNQAKADYAQLVKASPLG